jgi:hypothetical protein
MIRFRARHSQPGMKPGISLIYRQLCLNFDLNTELNVYYIGTSHVKRVRSYSAGRGHRRVRLVAFRNRVIDSSFYVLSHSAA